MRHELHPVKKIFQPCLLALGVASAGAAVNAQESSQDTAAPKRVLELEEVTVTAQRREESAQDVAISVTVFDQEQIANANMTNSGDLATYTPSLSVNTRFGNENTSFAIRGFTQSLRTTASVATYFAEVVAPRGQTSQTSGDGAGPGTLFDLENVQVLKGPQGTLFGRNTTGGAVLLVPNKPTDLVEGYVEYTNGDIGTERLQAVVNVPVSDNFKLRLGFDSNERDGHLNNVTDIGASSLGDTDYVAGRVSVLWDITDRLENYTIFTYTDSESNGYTSQLFDCNTNASPADNPFFIFTGPACQNQLAQQEANGQDGFYDLVSTVNTPITTIEEFRVINTTTWEINENLILKNIAAYAHLETVNGSDIFGTQFSETAAGLSLGVPVLELVPNLLDSLGLNNLAILPSLADPNREFAVGVSTINRNFPVTSQETFVEEIQLQGMAMEGRMIWQGGLYYETSQPDGFSGNNSASFLSCELSTIEGNDPSEYNCMDPLGGLLGGVLVQEYQTEYLNQAVYAQATYDFLDSLSGTLGLRYTRDETEGFGIKTRHTFILDQAQAPIVTKSRPEVESEAPTGMLELNYRPLENVMTYAKYTRGYRQGSVNLAADPGLDTHDYETVDTYEIGAKTSFGGPIPGRFNISAFYNELTDMQLQNGYISSTAGPTTAITNAGEAEIQGFEIESFLRLSESLSLNLSYSFLDTELLKQGTVSPETIAAAVTEASGNPISGQLAGATFVPIADVGDELPFSPEQSIVASLNYLVPVPGEWGVVNLGATYVYTGEQRAAASSASPHAILPDYELLNLNASWLGIMGSNFELTVFGTNVLEEEYLTYVSGVYNTLSFETRQVGLPKLIGARLRYNFGG